MSQEKEERLIKFQRICLRILRESVLRYCFTFWLNKCLTKKRKNEILKGLIEIVAKDLNSMILRKYFISWRKYSLNKKDIQLNFLGNVSIRLISLPIFKKCA